MIFKQKISRKINLIILFLLVFLFSCQKKKESTNHIPYNSKKVDQYFKLANKFYDAIKYDSAFYYANKTKLLIDPEKELSKYTSTMFILTMTQQLQGDYPGAQSTIVETLSLIEKLKTQRYNFKFHSMLAYNLTTLQEYDEALYYYNKALNLKKEKARKIAIKINIGYIYIEKKDFNQALKIFQQLLNEVDSKKNKYYYSAILNNLGYCYFKLGKPDAIKYLNQSLEINSNLDTTADNDYDLTTNYYYLYEYYLLSNQNKATNYAKLLYQKASQYNNPDDRLLALNLLIKNSSGKELKKYALNYIHINDSITKVRQKAKNYFAKLKYDSKKEKDENYKLKAEKELQQELERNKNIILSFIIVMIVIVSGFIYYYLIEKGKKEKIKTAYHTEIRIAKKLHDELSNDIYQTIAFAETQDLSYPNNTEKLLDNLDSIYKTTRNISKENNLIETGDLFVSNLKDMISGFNNSSLNIIINAVEEVDWITIANFKKITIYRVIQELLVNMKKHSESNLVILSFKKDENKLLINYFDNGKGMDFETVTKNGLRNIENKTIAINGTITFASKPNKGVKINMIIPI